MSVSTLLSLPPEILEQILLDLEPLDVAKASHTCRLLHDIVYAPINELFWRKLYLLQPFDDPRICLDPLGFRLHDFSYKTQLQRLIRARTVVSNLSVCRPDERLSVVRTLLDMALYTPPFASPMSDDLSINLVWLAAVLRNSKFLDEVSWEPSDDERQLRAHLHTLFGLTADDYRPARRLKTRSQIYSLDRYSVRNEFGPFLMDGSGRVDWEQVLAAQHLMSMQIVPNQSGEQQPAYTIFPMSLPFTQSVIPPGVHLDAEEDWAGVAGHWQFAFCFIDHRQLLELNDVLTTSDTSIDERRKKIFENPEFVEVFGGVEVRLTVTRMEHNDAHPTRPIIHFAGIGGSTAGMTMEGWVKVTLDDQIRWHFESGTDGDNVWSSEGITIYEL